MESELFWQVVGEGNDVLLDGVLGVEVKELDLLAILDLGVFAFKT